MIDRNKVIKAVDSCFDYWLDQHRYLHPLELETVRKFKADALVLLKEQEVRHGEWITIWEKNDPDISTCARCSICNRISERPLGMYCKWCGTKMDQE